MPVDKIFISHVVSEIIIIIGVSFYYHKKCSNLQTQIQELNNKLEKLNINNYLALIERQKHFEQQTVQHINKIYSMLKGISPDILNTRNSLYQENNFSNLQKHENVQFEHPNISEGFYPRTNEQTFQMDNIPVSTENKVNSNVEKKPPQNPFLSTLSMIGPLSTMFQVVMDKKPPHPDEIFKNLNVDNANESKKIVEVEDEVDSSTLDKELEDELNDLNSTVTTAVNTPVLVPRTPKHYLNENTLTPDKCENGICKIDFTSQLNQSNNSKNNIEPFDLETSSKITEIQNTQQSSQSSPLRYISQIPEQKRGRPKKN